MSNRITKPRTHTNAKSSDRRLASGIRPESYLKSEQLKAKQSKLSADVIASTSSLSPSPSTQDDKWDPAHFRLFVGNLGSDANDTILLKAFSGYKSVTKVKVPTDKSGANKGYGFVAFSDPNDYLKAFKEMNGKYIGHHPCMLKKANDLKQGKNGQKGRIQGQEKVLRCNK